MRRLTLVAFIFLCGCSTESQFIAVGNQSHEISRKLSEVTVYTDPSQVPWKYKVIGELYPERQPSSIQSPKDQIDDLRKKAWLNGADAIIVSHETQKRGGGSLYHGNGAMINREVMVFMAIAIVKADPENALKAVEP